MNVIYWDTTTRRARKWDRLSYKEFWPAYNAANAPQLSSHLLLVHTSDLANHVSGPQPNWGTLDEFVKALRAKFGDHLHVLYFSGGGQPWNAFANIDGFNTPPTADPTQHIHDSHFQNREDAFYAAVGRLVAGYKMDQTIDWAVLKEDYASKIADLLCALLVSCPAPGISEAWKLEAARLSNDEILPELGLLHKDSMDDVKAPLASIIAGDRPDAAALESALKILRQC